MTFAGVSLARRVEAAEAANALNSAQCQPGSAVLRIAGGCAVFLGVDSPLTHAVGIGLNGPVTEAEIGGIEAFFRSRGARPVIELSPLVDFALVEALGARGYRVSEFSNVLVRPLAGTEIVFTPRVRRAIAGEDDLWSHTLGQGFFDQPELTTEEMDIGRALFRMPGSLCYLAATENGEVAGGAALAIHDGLATLFADGAIARFRRQGLQRELIAARLNEAVARGCDMATASTAPGSGSQRNYERMGFEVVYTRITFAG